MKFALRLLILLPVLLFFLATAPGNRTETDMAFEHAFRVEQGVGLADPYFPLYVPLMRALYLPLRAAGAVDRAYPLMRFFSALCAAGAVHLFFLFCFRRFSLRPLSSLFATGFLMFSYGFWRFATEAEPLVPAAFFSLAAFYRASDPRAGVRGMMLAGLYAAVAAGLHALSLAPTLVMIPLYLVYSRRPRAVVPYLGVFVAALAVLLGTLGIVTRYRPERLLAPRGIEGLSRLALPAKAAVGFGQSVLSGIFLLRSARFRGLLEALFPHRMLGEEFYLGERLTWGEGWIPAVTLLALAGVALLAARRSWLERRAPPRAGVHATMVPGGRAVVAGTALWFLLHAGLVLLDQPGNPSQWIPGLIPLWLIFCAVLIAPLARANRLWIALLLFALFAAHNYAGGLRLVRDADRDYNVRKSEWILAEAGGEDVVVTAGNPVFVRYLRYYARARVIDLNEQELPEMILDATGPGRVFVLPDVLDYPRSMAVRFPGNAARVAEYAAELRGRMVPARETEFGWIWEIERPASIRAAAGEDGGDGAGEDE